MKLRIDMTGLRYGRLVGIGFSHRDRSGHAHWLFLCDCGGEVVCDGSSVRAGNTSSCGCLHREISAARLTTHGRRAAKRHDPTYRAWQGMNDACANPASPRYDRIGALGIGVAAAWRESFAAFLADMDERPENTVLDRNATGSDFGPGNCRWAPVRSRSRRAREGWSPRALRRAGSGVERPGCYAMIPPRHLAAAARRQDRQQALGGRRRTDHEQRAMLPFGSPCPVARADAYQGRRTTINGSFADPLPETCKK